MHLAGVKREWWAVPHQYDSNIATSATQIVTFEWHVSVSIANQTSELDSAYIPEVVVASGDLTFVLFRRMPSLTFLKEPTPLAPSFAACATWRMARRRGHALT